MTGAVLFSGFESRILNLEFIIQAESSLPCSILASSFEILVLGASFLARDWTVLILENKLLE